MTVSLAKPYRASADPHRVDEATVRARLTDLLGTTVAGTEIIDAGRFLPGGEGCYAAVAVLGYRRSAPFADGRYSTHLLVLPSEADGLRAPFLLSGHYDLSLTAASLDLAQR